MRSLPFSKLFAAAAALSLLLVWTPARAQEGTATASVAPAVTATTSVNPPPPEAEPSAPSKSKAPAKPPAPAPDATATTLYRNPQGSILIGGSLGFVGGGGSSAFILGVASGYAVFTGVVPGGRALLIMGDIFGGEIAGSLTLTPPIGGPVTPFIVGEVGRRYEPGIAGTFYGVGGGFYFGEPGSWGQAQLGYIYRRLNVDRDASGNTQEPVILSSPFIGFGVRL